MRHFAILTAGEGQRAAAYLLRAETPLAALYQFLRDVDSQLQLCEDGSVVDRYEKFRYEHPLAFIEESYRPHGEWRLCAVREQDLSAPCAEIVCGERRADIEEYIEQCLPLFRQSHPRSRARAFVWYLRAGPLVTFYRKKGRYRVEVLARYLLDREQSRGFIPWTGTHAEIFDQLWLGPWKIDP